MAFCLILLLSVEEESVAGLAYDGYSVDLEHPIIHQS